MRNTANVDPNDKNVHNARFVEVNSLPAVSQLLTPKQIVDGAIDETTLVRVNQDCDFGNFSLTNKTSITLTMQPVIDHRVFT